MPSPSSRRFLIVVNPMANDRAQYYLEHLRQGLRERGDELEVWYTTANEQANLRHLNQCKTAFTDWVVIGGDGTFNLVVNVLAHSQVPLALIPCGSGNDFARNLFSSADDPVAIALGELSQRVDLGLCNERYFANVLGVGFDGAVVASMYDKQPRRFRRWRYLLVALQQLFGYREQQVQLQSSLQKNADCFIAAFANGRYFGGGMQIAPRASIDDGMLDCCWVGKAGLAKKLYYLARIFQGRHLQADVVEYWQDRQFSILTPNLPIEGDGEFFGVTPARIQVVPQAIALKLPRGEMTARVRPIKG